MKIKFLFFILFSILTLSCQEELNVMTNSITEWKILNVTYNDLDMTKSVTDNINNLPILEQDSRMKIVFASDSIGSPLLPSTGINIIINGNYIKINGLEGDNFVTLFTKEGITLRTLEFNSNYISINTAQYMVGMYFVRVRNASGKSITFKAILR